MNVYCVKWGEKYGASHVNHLYESCLKHIKCDFDFYCLTENSKDINSDVKILSLPANNKLVKWWNKMYLFDSEIVFQKGEKLFLDLDVIIQKDIDPIIDWETENNLCFVKTVL